MLAIRGIDEAAFNGRPEIGMLMVRREKSIENDTNN
jgi:hypothetical protein